MKPGIEPERVCAICGTDKGLQNNHAGGRNYIAWFTLIFCERHHQQFHRLLEGVGIYLRYTPDKLKRLVTAATALTIALWMVLQALAEEISLLPEKKS
jgi:hypothetical protein